MFLLRDPQPAEEGTGLRTYFYFFKVSKHYIDRRVQEAARNRDQEVACQVSTALHGILLCLFARLLDRVNRVRWV